MRSSSASGFTPLQRKPGCTCGGGCPRCQAKSAPSRYTVNTPGDRYEQEADRVAEQVMRMPDPQAASVLASGAESSTTTPRAGALHASPPSIQRACGSCAGAKPEREEEEIQTKEERGRTPEVSGEMQGRIDSLRGGGDPLPATVRSYFEPRFGADFSGVRVHTDGRAAESARGVQAQAYTIGTDIVFGAGRYAPESAAGRHLLAHELVHVVQQSKQPILRRMIQRALTLSAPSTHTTYLSAQDNGRTRAELLESWLATLCPTGQWTVDRATGRVSSGAAASFCAEQPTAGVPHHSTSGTPTSCNCLCTFTRPGGQGVDIVIDERMNADRWVPPGQQTSGPRLPIYTIEQQTADATASGGGATLHKQDYWLANTTILISGREGTDIPGSGDTSPRRGGSARQIVRDPPWIILGHELCGHVLRHGNEGGEYHAQTPEGSTSAVDIENRIRREHSTAGNNFGTRRGQGAGDHEGSIVRLRPNETGASLSTRLGIEQGRAAWGSDGHLWVYSSWSGDAYDRESFGRLHGGDLVFVRGVFYYDVASGDTLASIARMWGVPVASIRRANPDLTGEPAAGTRLIIPIR